MLAIAIMRDDALPGRKGVAAAAARGRVWRGSGWRGMRGAAYAVRGAAQAVVLRHARVCGRVCV